MTLFEATSSGLAKEVSAGLHEAAGDSTAPTLSSPVDAANGPTAGTGTVDTDEDNGTLYFVVTTSATSPSAAQVKAGEDHTGSAATDSGSQAVSATGTQTVTGGFTGLTAATGYYAHYMHEDAAENQSSVSTASGFTTGTYAVLDSSAKQSGVTLSNGDLTYSIAATGATYRQCYITVSVPSDDADGWFFEITMDSGHGNNANKFGVATSAAKTADSSFNVDTGGTAGFYNFYDFTSSPKVQYNHSGAAGVDADASDDIDASDIWGVLIKNRRISIYRNGSLVYTTASDLPDENVWPYITSYSSASIHQMTVEFGASGFAHTVPSGSKQIATGYPT